MTRLLGVGDRSCRLLFTPEVLYNLPLQELQVSFIGLDDIELDCLFDGFL